MAFDEAQAIEVGKVIQFGGFPFRVIFIDHTAENDYALLLCEGIVDKRAFHGYELQKRDPYMTWKRSDIRDFLNWRFCARNLSAAEQERVAWVINQNPFNEWYGWYGRRDNWNAQEREEMRERAETEDRIFLLSIEEVVRYLGDSGQLTNRPAEYGWHIDDEYNEARRIPGESWMLRSPGNEDGDGRVAFVDMYGVLSMFGHGVSGVDGIRPAMWIRI